VIRIVIPWFLAALLLLGHVGVAMYTHVCEEEGVSTSFFIPDNSHCEKELSDLPACCQKKKKKDCCHNETKVFKLQSDYSTSFLRLNVDSPILAFDNHFFDLKSNTFVLKRQTSAFSGTDPPPLPFGREKLIRNQVFRI